jgi:protein SCO1/2
MCFKPSKSLPIFNPSDVNPELVDSTVQYISKYHTLLIFRLNQNGKQLHKRLWRKIYVADFSLLLAPLFVQND